MKTYKGVKIGVTLLACLQVGNLAFADPGTGEPRAMMKETKGDANQILNDAANVYKNLKTGPHGSVPQPILNKTDCVAVIPGVVTAAAVVGGSHGDGVASCKTSSGKWSAPIFFDLSRGSLGAQVGAKKSDLVLYFTNPESVAALKRGKFEFGADASVVAGSFDRTAQTAPEGVVAYERAEGAYMGAALSGGSIATDEDTNTAYYGKKVDCAAVLEGRETFPHKSDAWTLVLP